MENYQDTIDRLGELGGRTPARNTFTWDEARERLDMDEQIFQRAWPAFYIVVAHEDWSSPEPPTVGLSPWRPEPGQMALLFDPGGGKTWRPNAVVLRDPWEIVELPDNKLGVLLDELNEAGREFDEQVRSWAKTRTPQPLPDALLEAGFRYRDAFLNLARRVFHEAGRKVQFDKPVLPPRLNIAVADEMLLAQTRLELIKLQATVAAGEEEFWRSEDAQDATIKRLATIGEAANQLSDAFKQQHDGVPWKQLVGLRNVLDHNLEGGPNLTWLWRDCVTEVPMIADALRRA